MGERVSKKRKEVLLKIKYEGVFNWFGETHKMWCYAYTLGQAKQLFILRIADKIGCTTSKVRNYFASEKDNFQIEEV